MDTYLPIHSERENGMLLLLLFVDFKLQFSEYKYFKHF